MTVAALAAVLAGAPFHFDVPEVVERTEVAGDVHVDGVPVAMEVVVTRWPIDKLIQHFADQFDAAGFYMAPHQKSPVRQLTLTAFDPSSKTTYSVIFDEGPGKLTTLVLGVARFGQQAKAVRKDFAPAFPGAEQLLRTEDEGMRTLAFRARAKPEEVRDFYEKVLASAGYSRVEPGLYQRGDEQFAVATLPLPDGRTHVVVQQRAGTVFSRPPDGQPAEH